MKFPNLIFILELLHYSIVSDQAWLQIELFPSFIDSSEFLLSNYRGYRSAMIFRFIM